MKKTSLYKHQFQFFYYLIMKTERIIAATGLLLSIIIYLLFQKENSSSLVLIGICAFGCIAFMRYPLAGGLLLFCGGAALIVHPLLFSSSYWFIPAGALMSYAGFIGLIKWWRQNDNR